jgi:predicted MPP superfamily phosphohydrolase
MPVFFILLLGSYLLGNVYIFVRGIQALGQIPLILKWICGLSYWMCALMLFAVFALRNVRQIPFSPAQILFHTGSGWLVFTLYMVIFLACTDFARVLNHSFTNGFSISLLMTVCLLIYGYIKNNQVEVRYVDIKTDKEFAGKSNFKVVGLSDLHLGLGTDRNKLAKTIDLVNKENPDLVIIAGDLIDNNVNPVRERQMYNELNRLKSEYGIFMVPGNHEYISDIDKCIEFLELTGITLLRDSIVSLPCGIQILGRDDYSNKRRLPIDAFKGKTDPAMALIIIDHQPNHLDDAKSVGADLQFSGHTHNGQIIPLKWLTSRMFELSYGYLKKGETNYYVSSGASLWGPPFRIGSNNEIVVFSF